MQKTRAIENHKDFNNVVVITGASQGFGRRLALRYAERQVKLVVAARNEDLLKELVEEIRENIGNKNVTYCVTDVTDLQQCRNLIDLTIQAYGKIDKIILAAGVSMHSSFKDIQDMEQFKTVMDVNVFGAINPSYFAIPHLRKTEGKIIVISSITSVIPYPDRTAYCASKHALTGFFRTVRMEEPDIKILLVHPSTMVGTNFRKNSLAMNTSLNSHKYALDVDQAVELTIDGIDKDKTEIYFPFMELFRANLFNVLSMLLPDIHVPIIKKAYYDQVKGKPKL